MSIETKFEDIGIEDLMIVANRKRSAGWRAVQMLCTNTEEGVDMTYTFSQDGVWENYRIKGVAKEQSVPSLQGLYLCLFPFENEAHDLFGVNIEGMVLDFEGRFYDVAQPEPMTIISPEQQAAREKARKAAAAKKAKAAKAAAAAKEKAAPEAAKAGDAPAAPAAPKIMSIEEIEAKCASLAPEKAEKLRAALIAKRNKQLAEAGEAGKAGE